MACVLVLSLAVDGLAANEARADLPAPQGQTKVGYSFQLTGTKSGVVLVAFPMYNSAGGNVLELALDEAVMTVQGWTPGIYSIGASDLASIRGKDDPKEIADVLAAKGHVCVKAVPRVFTVPTATRVDSLTDVFKVDANASACLTSFTKTLYKGADGARGEGTIDASGHRHAPPPFGKELPDVGDLGFAIDAKPAPPSASSPDPAGSASPLPSLSPAPSDDKVAPARGGCAGCVVSRTQENALSSTIALSLALAIGLRRRRSGLSKNT